VSKRLPGSRLQIGVLSGLLALAGRPAIADTTAVLPFWNQAAESASQSSSTQTSPPPARTNMDWIGESIAEMLRETMASRGVLCFERTEIQEAIHRLRLRDRASLTQASVIKIGEELDAEQILFGSFQVTPNSPSSSATGAATAGVAKATSAGSLKVTARLMDRKHMRMGTEFTETGALEDLATIEAHLAWRAMTLIAPKLAPQESDFKTLRPVIRLDAEENYVRGLLARDSAQREKYFLQAARLDVRFAHPNYQLGQIHMQRKEYRQAAEWLEKVSADDTHYRAAAFLLGLARYYSGDYPAAQKAFQIVAETVPLSEVYNNLGAAESRRSLPQAVDDFRKALAGDEHDPVYQFNLGYALWKKADFTEAADHFRSVLDRDPEDQVATLLLGRCLKKQGPRGGRAGGAPDSDARLVGIERLKTNYEERAYRQLRAVIDAKQ
jgi:tetratricopeptide (TPR) repeat protein